MEEVSELRLEMKPLGAMNTKLLLLLLRDVIIISMFKIVMAIGLTNLEPQVAHDMMRVAARLLIRKQLIVRIATQIIVHFAVIIL